MNSKEIVKGTNANFVNYRKGNLWYEALYGEKSTGSGNCIDGDCVETVTHKSFLFPVPIEDVGDGVFPASVRAITLMPYIRKHLKTIESEN
jgi:hypothetical protein